jgi:cis-L-3-hydroxyproline dehydratase
VRKADTAIEEVDIYGYDLSYVHGEYVMSGGRSITTLPSTVVRVTTRSGVTGFGEVCPLGSAYLPGFGRGVRAALAEMAPSLLGADVGNPATVSQAMEKALRGHEYAKSAVDIACWDAFGRASGQPVASLLGGVLQREFPLYVAVPLAPAKEMLAYVEARREEGIHTFQLKLGAEPRQDATCVEQVVLATGENDRVIADANGGWRLPDAVVAARLLEHLPRVYLEQPCRTIEECLSVRGRTTLPLILDEVVTDVQALIRCYAAGAVDAVNLKISRVGGLTKAKLLRDLIASLGLRVTIEDTWGGDLTTAAVSHLAASTPPEALFTVSFMNDWTAEHIAGYQPRSARGIGCLPGGSGLAVDVDLDRLGAPLFSTGRANIPGQVRLRVPSVTA